MFLPCCGANRKSKKGNNASVIPLAELAASFVKQRLFGSLCSWNHIDEHPPARLFLEGDLAFNQGKQRVILAHPDIVARMNLGAALAHNDVAGKNGFAAELLDAKTATCGIATVT